MKEVVTMARDHMHEKHCRWLRCQHNQYRLDGVISEGCPLLDDQLNKVEDDRAHAEAEKLREMADRLVFNLLDPFSPQKEGWIRSIADAIDPYETRDGQLVRKSDGKPVTI